MSKGRVPWPSSIPSFESPSKKEREAFKCKSDHRKKPHNRTGEDVLVMIKDVKVVFGKGQGSESILKDAKGHAPMWKKKSIF